MKLFRNTFKRFRKGTLLDTTVLVILSLIIIIIMTFGAVVSRMFFDLTVKQTENMAVQAIFSLSHFIFQEDGDNEKRLKRYMEEISAERLVVKLGNDVTYFPPDAQRELEVDLALERAQTEGSFFIINDKVNGMHVITAVGPLIKEGEGIKGAATVSYPLVWVETIISKYFGNMVYVVFIFITLSLIAAVIIAKRIKKSIFWLEPYEIAIMLQELSAIIESIREAIVSTDIDGRVKLMNRESLAIFGDIKGLKFQEIIPDLNFRDITDLKDREIIFSGVELLINIMPLYMDNEIIGYVATIRKKDEIELIAKELTQVQEYAQMLRAQTHEFNNRMHAIVGMVQMKAYDSLLEYIMELSGEQKFLAHNLKDMVSDSAVMSLLIGKFMSASEKKIKFRINEESSMHDIPKELSRTHLLTIIGNLIDNAFEASQERTSARSVLLFMSDYGKDLIFEVEDSGFGIPQNLREKIFERGYSTKSRTGRGVGMYLVKNAVTYLKGSITIGESELGGTLVTVIIPKNQKRQI